MVGTHDCVDGAVVDGGKIGGGEFHDERCSVARCSDLTGSRDRFRFGEEGSEVIPVNGWPAILVHGGFARLDWR